MPSRILPIVLASAVIGAGAAVGIVEGFGLGNGGHSTTLVQQAPLATPSDTRNSDGGLTASV